VAAVECVHIIRGRPSLRVLIPGKTEDAEVVGAGPRDGVSDPGMESDRKSPYDQSTLYESGIWLTR
jgi:hypothetical protein